jgi:hypothetical protein
MGASPAESAQRRRPRWFAAAVARDRRRSRKPKNQAIRRNRRPLPAIDFMPFLTHLYGSAEPMALNGGFACVLIDGADSNRQQQESGHSSTYEGNRAAGEGRPAH